MVTRTEAIKNFLNANTIADLSVLYNYQMEVQVNVAQDGGHRIEGEYKGRRWHGWEDELGNTWKSFRIPRNANTEPEYTDTAMNFDLAAHAEGIGMTGWDWQNRVSKWVAYDFDAIVGHSDKNSKRLTQDELLAVQDAAKQLPWVTLRRSTSGKGIHLYVFVDDVPTANHNEHAALARAILGKMSAMTGFDFQTTVDVCGGNMWCWHRKMKGTNGLELLQQGDKLYEIPVNWQDHIPVTSRKRNRVLPNFINDTEQEVFEELTGQRTQVKLDAEHRSLISFLDEAGASFWWDQDHHMLVCHTFDLKVAFEELQLRGVFNTLASGKDRGHDHNCFMFPLKRGGWIIRRYTAGVAETATWDQDNNGYTFCYYNIDPTLRIAARSSGGLEDDKGNFVFRSGEEAETAAALLGTSLGLEPIYLTRPTVLRPHKDGRRLIAEVERRASDTYLQGWLEVKKGTQWQRVFSVSMANTQDIEIGNYDDTIRHLVSQDDDCGWAIKSGEQWHDEPLTHAKAALDAMGLKPSDVKSIIGNAVIKPWKIVNEPFQPEYPGDRSWNRNSVQLNYAPASEEGSYETWLSILDHIGAELTPFILANEWATSNGLKTGADYLKCWISSLFQYPTDPLPYLFLYGPQASGKSIFHEALELLLIGGYCRADMALTSTSNFNSELEHAILCVVEETDLKKNKLSYNRIKDWTTAPLIPIRAMYRSPYLVVNTTHWVQCSNEREACPVFAGDTRIVMIYVPELEKPIPKRDLVQNLKKEAPYFLREILTLELPTSQDRLNLPAIQTADKDAASDANSSMLDIFINETCHYVPGSTITVSDFYDAFQSWLEPADRGYWSKIRIGRKMPAKYPKGRLANAQWAFGNISFEEGEGSVRLINQHDKLVEVM